MESDTYRELGAKKSKARWPETRGAAFLLPSWRRCANWAFPQGTSPRSSDLPLRNSTRTLDSCPLEAAGVEIVEENGGKGWREAEETRTRKTPSGKISSRLKSSQPRDIKPIKRDEDGEGGPTHKGGEFRVRPCRNGSIPCRRIAEPLGCDKNYPKDARTAARFGHALS